MQEKVQVGHTTIEQIFGSGHKGFSITIFASASKMVFLLICYFWRRFVNRRKNKKNQNLDEPNEPIQAPPPSSCRIRTPLDEFSFRSPDPTSARWISPARSSAPPQPTRLRLCPSTWPRSPCHLGEREEREDRRRPGERSAQSKTEGERWEAARERNK